MKESEKLLSEIINQTFIGFAIFQDFEIKYFNPEFSKVIGYPYEEIIKWKPKEFFNIINPADRDRAISLAQKLYSGNNNALNFFQLRIVKKPGDTVWIEIQTKPINFEGKKADLIFLQDITPYKEAEQKLKVSEEQYRDLVSNLTDIILKINLKGVVTYVSPQCYDIMGYQPSELIGKNCFDYICSEDWLKIMEQMKNSLKTKDIISVEYGLLHKNGNKITASGNGRYTNFNGNEGFIITIRDITVHKEIEDKLKESEEKYKILFKTSPHAVGLINSKGTVVQVNSNVEKVFGYTKEEILGKKFGKFRLFSEEHTKLVFDSFSKLIKGEIPEIQELQLHRKDGTVIWVSMQASIVRLSNETLFQVITQDISKQKVADLKLKESDDKHKSMINSLDIGFFRVSLDGTILNHNPKYNELFGEDPSESLVGRKTFELWHESDEREKFLRDLKNFGFVKDYTAHAKKITGEKIILQGNVHLIRNNNDIPIASEGTMIDITDKYLLEQKLKESEEKYRLITEHANDLIDVLDEKFRYEYINEEIHKRVLGYSKEEMIGKFAGKFVHLDDLEEVVENLREGFEKSIGMTECRVKKKDGTYIWYESKGNVFLDKYGNKKALIMSRDITERKIAEQKLKESEEKFRHLFEKSPFSIILFDSEGIIKDCNSVTEEMFGFTKEEFLGNNYFLNPSINPDHLPITKKRYEQLKEGESLFPQEVKIFRADGTSIWINSQISKVKILNRTYFYSIIQDITNKKILEDIMFELNQNFFNFTSDFQENIQSLTQTAKKLSKGNLVLYAKKIFHEDGSTIQIITSENEVINCNFTDFKQKYFINEIFKLKHETPEGFPNLNRNNYNLDPFIQIYSLKGAYGKIIKNLDDFTSIIAILYENMPEISYEEQLVLLLISDAIAIEEKRWQLLEKLEEQNAKLSELDKLKSEFLRRISHELKTPLISIKGYSQLLLYTNKGILDNDTLSMIEEITNGCVRLENLISELIESSKLESAQVKLKLTFEDLALLIRNSVNELQGIAKTRNQEIILNIHENLITKFEKKRMHEVIGNLLTNAIKYSPPSNSIVIKSEIKDGFYVISVKDNGIGFTLEEKQKLFKQFGKIDRFDQEAILATDGSGLGLYITKKLVELHGGKIWVESEGKNKGSTFYFTLPIIKD